MKRIDVTNLAAYYRSTKAIDGVTLSLEPKQVTALIGPSGCGKSTFIRTLNRMHEVISGTRVEGKVLLDGEDIYAPSVDPVSVRRSIGMVFQRPNPFPSMTVRDNVSAGLRLNGRRKRNELDGVVERSLQQAGLWEEGNDRLDPAGARWAQQPIFSPRRAATAGGPTSPAGLVRGCPPASRSRRPWERYELTSPGSAAWPRMRCGRPATRCSPAIGSAPSW